jgi:chromosome segregation ATPase
VTQKRSDRQPQQAPSAEPPARPEAEPPPAKGQDKDEGRISLFWRVFGGALLSIAAMVGVTVYQQLTSNLSSLRADLVHLNTDLRKDLGRISESYGDLVKKEDCSSRLRSVWDSIKDVQGDRSDLTALEERCAVLTELFKASEAERRQLAREIQQLREQQAGASERQEVVREIRQLRERIALLEGRQASASAVTPASPQEKAEEP